MPHVELEFKPSEASLHACEAALRQAQLASDVGELDRLVDDALVFIGPNGASTARTTIWTRTDAA